MRGSLSMVVAVALAALSATAQGASEAEKREEILKRIGLEKDESLPPPSEPEDSDEDDDSDGEPKKVIAIPAKDATVYYAPTIHSLFVAKCQRCHRDKGKAKKSDLYVLSDTRSTFEAASKYVTAGKPQESQLYTQAMGKKHKGGKTLKPGTPELRLLERWILDGAQLGSPRAVAAATAKAARTVEAAEAESEEAVASLPDDAAIEVELEIDGAGEANGEQAVAARQLPTEADDHFRTAVHPALVRSCADCHEGENADARSGEGFWVANDVDASFASAIRYVSLSGAQSSSLVQNPLGGDEHDEVWRAGDPDLAIVADWIQQMAAPEEALDVQVAASDPQGLQPGHGGHHMASRPRPGIGDGTLTGRYKNYGLQLPLGFRLNGRFDLNYERRDYEGNPFKQDATAALRTYHNFLFVSRDAGTDGIPFGISIEAITLQFWEAYFLHEPKGEPWRLLLKMGRILVPFGADPLYHNSYGGLAAFDQRLLPIFWAQEGVAANGQLRLGPLTLSDDIYVVRGYELRNPEGRLELQSDFSSRDEIELGGGNRFGVSYGPATAWYSLYYNGLESGRDLVMQALDVVVYRPDVPVLEYFAASAGIMRADVSGGGPGVDYYDFGSYWEFHLYPFPGLDLRYRQGVRTFDNRADWIFDERQRSSRDGSTHTLGATYRYRGLELAVHHFWNFEKADEIEDDFLRFTVAYAF